MRKTFFGVYGMFRSAPIWNNRKRTAGRRFTMMPVKSGTAKSIEADRRYPPQEPQPHVGVADFGAMRRGYHLGSRRYSK